MREFSELEKEILRTAYQAQIAQSKMLEQALNREDDSLGVSFVIFYSDLFLPAAVYIDLKTGSVNFCRAIDTFDGENKLKELRSAKEKEFNKEDII